jgi:ribonuclease P protein component
MQSFSFSKDEKLKSRKAIASIFSKRLSIGAYPLRFFYSIQENENSTSPVKVGFSVSKKLYKRAVDRNRLKRLMREVYRHEKQSLIDFAIQNKIEIIGIWVFVGKEISEIGEIKQALLKSLKKLQLEITTN